MTFFFFFSLILYFQNPTSTLDFLSSLFGICYQFCAFKNAIFSTHFYLGADYWLDCSLPSLNSPFSPPGRLYLLPPPSLLYPTLWISLCVPDSGEHLGNWLLAGSVSLLLILPFMLLATSVSFLPLLFSVWLCEYLWAVRTVGHTQGSDYWLACSLLFWFHFISFRSLLTPSSLFSSPCNSVNLSGCPSLWRNFSSLT